MNRTHVNGASATADAAYVSDFAPEPRRELWRRSLKDQRGMTLIEIMVVLAIIGMIMGGLAFGYMSWFKQSQTDIAKTQVQRLGSALMNYYLHHQEFPGNLDELASGENATLKKTQLKDPWNQDWTYNVPAQRGQGDFDLCSKGQDKSDGTDDDICLE